MTKEKKTWRLVDSDNFGGDYPNESFVAIGIPTKGMAEALANAWNDKLHPSHDRYLRVVEHIEVEYVLVPGFEP